MQIGKNKVATIKYLLKNNDGEVLDSSEGQADLVYLHGANNIISGLENALVGKTAGDALKVVVSPEDGYGTYNETMLQTVSIEMFDGAEVKVGVQFNAENPQGEAITVTVKEVNNDEVVIDGNHPLAGVNLHFDLTISDVREATNEERDHGHAHAPGGHHH